MTVETLAGTTSRDLVRQALTGKKVSWVDALIAFLLLFSLLASLVILVVLLYNQVALSLPVFRERGFDVVTSQLSARPATTGMIQGIFGSVMLTLFVIVLAFPTGVAAAIYLEEYASDNRVNRLIVSNIRNLAGVPSIVYGLLGLTVFVKIVLEGLVGQNSGRTLLAGGLTLAVLVLPIMVITAQEALRAVPQALREASFGVGATRWETIRYHVLPVATPATLTGAVLTVARAFGESAPLLLAGAVLSNFFTPAAGARLWEMLFVEKYTALPIIVYNWSRQPQEEFVALTAAAIVVLLVVLLTVNAVTIYLRDRSERRHRT
jgi:phosphate transport system permease protein